MGRRSLRASSQGIQDIKKALKRKKWSQTYIAGTVDCSRQTIWSLLQGNPTDCDVFMEVCTQLGLNWEEIAEPESPEPEQNDSQDIDALVREVRSRAYADIKKRTGTMRMLRVNHPVPVTDIYVDLNILKRVSSDFSFSDWRGEFKFDWRSFDRLGLGRVEQERIPAIEKIRDCRKLMVLGKPGAGKSTLLKVLATACIEGKLAWDESECLPVFITLREFAEDEAEDAKFSLRDAIQQQFDRLGVAEAAEPFLQQGRGLILLDGLDEVPTHQSNSVVRQMYRFCRDYSDNRFIITCRTQSLKSRFEAFIEAEIADFTPKQVERFIQKWFAVVVGNNEAGKFAERLIWQLQENEPIAELVVTPILLNLTCSVFWDRRGKLPTKRSELYELGLKDLLQRLARPEALGEEDLFKLLTRDDKENLLAQVAYTLFEENDYFPEQRKLERLIANHLQIQRSEAEHVLRSLEAQHGLIIERSEGYFSFSHLTFQEYFTAKYILDSSKPEAALQRLVNHITEPRWREVFLLLAEMLPSADRLLQLMKQQVDSLLANDERLQEFLFWVYLKSIPVKDNYYQPVAIRVFYLCLEYIYGFRLFDLDEVIDLANRFDVSVHAVPF
jgi:predicted NACHT family NTPase/transcriptional regulator with XRE-family HTH domain